MVGGGGNTRMGRRQYSDEREQSAGDIIIPYSTKQELSSLIYLDSQTFGGIFPM